MSLRTDRERAGRLLHTVLRWPETEAPLVRRRSILILELVGAHRDPGRVERTARGLYALLRHGAVPPQRARTVLCIVSLARCYMRERKATP